MAQSNSRHSIRRRPCRRGRWPPFWRHVNAQLFQLGRGSGRPSGFDAGRDWRGSHRRPARRTRSGAGPVVGRSAIESGRHDRRAARKPGGDSSTRARGARGRSVCGRGEHPPHALGGGIHPAGQRRATAAGLVAHMDQGAAGARCAGAAGLFGGRGYTGRAVAARRIERIGRPGNHRSEHAPARARPAVFLRHHGAAQGRRQAALRAGVPPPDRSGSGQHAAPHAVR